MSFRALAELARGAHGVVTHADARSVGVTSSTLAGWAACGRLDRLHIGVYSMPGMPPSFERSLCAAVKAAGEGAVASHRSALQLWQLRTDDIIEVSVPYERAVRLAGVEVHRSRDLASARLRHRSGIPVTDPMRAIIDAGAVLTPAEVEDALDEALSRRLFSHASIEWAYSQVGRPGRNGSGVIRRILDRRALGAASPDSLLEPRMARLLLRHELPSAVFQHPVTVDGRHFRIDFAYPDLMLAIEVDGWQKFATPDRAAEVLHRQNALARAGWTILRFTWRDVVSQPRRVALEIADALAHRLPESVKDQSGIPA